LVPFVILPLLIFAVYCGQVGMLSLKVERAAREAARAASQQLEKTDAKTIAQSTIVDSLGSQQAQHCKGWTGGELPDSVIDVEGVGEQPEGFADQGIVTVTLECDLDLSVFGPFITTTRFFKTTAIESVDEFRSRTQQ
jgi:hypothetical protein